MGPTYESTKTYGQEAGFSCTFRQWKATSHCRELHGYALGFTFTFAARVLDERNWVYDFGGCDWIKKYLRDMFDHKTVIAEDDPELQVFRAAADRGVLDLVLFPAVGCEKFAEIVYNNVAATVALETNDRVRLKSVKVFEHQGNSATYSSENC